MGFGNPLLFDAAEHRGIALIRVPGRATKDLSSTVASTLASGIERASISGELWVIQRGRIREYRPDQDRG